MTATASDLINLTVDGTPIQVPKGTLLVEAAKQIHVDVPVYCYHPKLGPAGLCRVCLVEIEGTPKLQIACNTTVTEGMVVHTGSAKANEGRRTILELLLLNHPLDCPICDKGGECDLQDYAMAYGQGASRMIEPKTPKPKAVDLGPTIVLDEERCVLCLRCVRFDELITHEQSLRTDDRGVHAIIATATGEPYVSDFSGNVTELCPVGALTSKTYRFRSRPWDNHRTTTTCTQCSVGCAMHVDQRVGLVARTMSVAEDTAISDGWLCDRGRYNIGYLGDERRLTQPLLKRDGEWQQIGWDDAIATWADTLKGGIPAAIGGGRLLNEEAFLLQYLYRALGIQNLDWRAGRQQRAYPQPPGGTYADLEQAQVIVTVGQPPEQLAPVLDLRIRKAVMKNGARLIVVGDSPPSSVLPARHVTTFADALAALPHDAQRIALVWDGVLTPHREAVMTFAESAAAAGKTVHRFVLMEQPNARGAECVGMQPGPGGLDTAGIFAAGRAGKLTSLALLGVNPVLRYPDRQLVVDALAATPFVVVSDLFMTETAELANLVLPACSAFEKSGTTTDLIGDLLPVVASVLAPDEAWADGDMLVALADALHVNLPAPEEMEAQIKAALAQPPRYLDVPAPDAAPRAMVGVETARVVIESNIFSGGGTATHDPALGELLPRPRARLHPATAKRLGVAQGDEVDVNGPEGARLEGLTVVLDRHFPEGAIGLLDGLPNAPVNALGGTPAVAVSAKVRA